MIVRMPASFSRLALAVLLCGCASAGRPAASSTAPQEQVSDRLYFGQAIPGGGMVSDSAWRVFLRDVVTPAFPDGLTVWRAEGQWRDPGGEIIREPVIIVEVVHPRGVPADSVFERIAHDYRTRFRQDAVLRTSAPARLWLYERP